ncbi:type II toxin-antitoxin system RelE family toxin [Oceanivirga salmonicida]|uniref:type II toxin-antitoxin system RelE family toxin n=1 Tax=Oceanivirga salmonicida TaxID=1769291 RepID=UPI0012E22B57|nr:type II toxin-antitoxin system RelE/ParE family toxin [Oceanivirga salmonicida]
MKQFKVIILPKAEKQLKKLDKTIYRIIVNYILKNLIDTSNPRQNGKALKGKLNGLWRYRVGDYRILAEIKDNELIILLIEIAHRKNICNS